MSTRDKDRRGEIDVRKNTFTDLLHMELLKFIFLFVQKF